MTCATGSKVNGNIWIELECTPEELDHLIQTTTDSTILNELLDTLKIRRDTGYYL